MYIIYLFAKVEYLSVCMCVRACVRVSECEVVFRLKEEDGVGVVFVL